MNDTITITPEERRLLRTGGYVRLLDALEQAEANVAQLISAAPDLFEALKKAIDALERADDSFGVPGLHGIINEADAAIRKAEGES